MKRIGIIILIVVTITLGIILGIKVIQTNNKENNNIISNQEINSDSELYDEEIKNEMNILKQTLENKSDKTILIVNGEKISEKEIAYINFQLNNEETNEKDAITEAIEEYVILTDAERKNITLTDNKLNQIEQRAKSLKEDDEITKIMLDTFNMEYDEFIEFYKDMDKKSQIIIEWNMRIINAINNEEIKIDNQLFNNKYNQYKSSEDATERYNLLLELKSIYIDYLKSNAIIEYTD